MRLKHLLHLPLYIFRNDLSTRREEIDARLAAAEAKAQKIKEEEIHKSR
jgi:hypothetical protein